MNNASRLFMMALATSAVSFTASAVVVFQDDFEDEAVGLATGAPQIGTGWVDTSTGGVPLFGADVWSIVSSPAKQTRSMKTYRADSGQTSSIKGFSLPGAVVDGNTVEVSWDYNLEHAHTFNGSMDVALGVAGSGYNNDFTDIGSGNLQPNIEYYQGPGQYTNLIASSTKASRNTPGANEGMWDSFKVTLHFVQQSATVMGGTMDIDANINNAGWTNLATGVPMMNATIPAIDPTVLQLHLSHGPFAGIGFYDNFSAVVVPEPTALAGLAGVALMGLRRRRA
jgi:hypothetical protein